MYPTKSKVVTAPYGVRGSWWAAGYHTGTDFAASIGTPIYATKQGVVVFSGYSGGWGVAYGYHVIVSSYHDGKFVRHMYAHLYSRKVGIGERVKAGQLIGYSGNSGNTSGPHLHYEERWAPYGYYNNKAPILLSYKPPVTISVSKAQPGKNNRHVRRLKRRMNRYFPNRKPLRGTYFGKELRNRYAEYQRNLGYSGSSADGRPGWKSLRKLGFRVIK